MTEEKNERRPVYKVTPVAPSPPSADRPPRRDFVESHVVKDAQPAVDFAELVKEKLKKQGLNDAQIKGLQDYKRRKGKSQ